MFKRTFVFLALAFALFGTQCWAITCPQNHGAPLPCTNTFSPGTTTNTYDFSGTGDGVLTVQFVTVLTTFNLTVTVDHNIDAFDPDEFPVGTVAVTYSNGNTDQYDFSGNAVTGGFMGVPVRNQDYKGLITLTLTYFTDPTTVQDPAFAHAPDGSTTFTENILTVYSEFPINEIDPTMNGQTPNLSSVAAANQPFTETGDSPCSLTLLGGSTFTVGQQIEVDYVLANGAGCGIRDKTATFSLAQTDGFGDFISFPPVKGLEGNKFHWENQNGVNEFDFSTVGLTPGNYTVTVISSKISPQSVSFTLNPAP
jgi:hypothetical protein